MAEQIKFTDEEVKQINELRVEASQIFTQLGQISIEKSRRAKQYDQQIEELNTVETELLKKHSELSTKEQEMYKTLNGKYGDGTYDPDSGIFTPLEKTEK